MLGSKRIVVAVVLFGVGVARPALAERRTHYEAAREALTAKDYRTAESEALASVDETEAFGATDARHLDALTELADVYRETRQWAAAASLLEQVVAAMQQAGTADSPEAGLAYNNLGVTYQQMHDDAKAQVAYEAALAIERRKYRDNVASIAIVVTNLGEIYRRDKDWAKAEWLHKQSIADEELDQGPDSPRLVPSLTNLALVYTETGRFNESLALLMRAKRIAEKGENGGRGADMATVLHELGDVYARQGKNREAKPLYESAIAMRKEVLGATHPNVAESLNNYGGVLMGLSLFDEALRAYDEAIAIRQSEFGSSDPRTTLVMSNKALCLDRMKRFAEAAELRSAIEQLKLRHQAGD